MHWAGSREAGFTTVELIVAIVVAGILAAVALPYWRGDTGFEERGFRDETMAALRYAQKTAIAARRHVCATFAAGQAAFVISTQAPELANDCTNSIPLVLANGTTNLVQGSSFGGATYAAPVPATIIFDAAGRNTGAQATITVTNLANLPIVVEAETGYVH